MRKIFVTGGAGFIGSAFVRLVLRETDDVEIVNYDALTYAGNLANITGINDERHRFVKGDICARDDVLAAIPENAQAVFNFAAETHVDRSIDSANEFIRTNIVGTQILLTASIEMAAARFVQISTDEVFGSLDFDDSRVFTEESPISPNNPYAASKASAEHFVCAAHQTFGLDTVITRSGNNYGPRQHPEKLIPMTISKAFRDQEIPVYGDGRNIRDWIYVDDHCRAIWQIFKGGNSGETYNIGARCERTNLEVIRELLDLLRKPHSLIEFVEDRKGHDKRYAIDPSKTESIIGWNSEIGWEEGLRRTVESYLKDA